MRENESAEDFTVAVKPVADVGERVLVASGKLTAAGGELLYCAVQTLSNQPTDRMVADLRRVSAVDPSGWCWLLPAMQLCSEAGSRLEIVPPVVAMADDAPSEPQPAEAEPVRLRFYPDGPVLCRGPVELLGRDGELIPHTRAVVALCRCGASAIKPFCDGSHKSVGFRDN
jgi:ABC-type transporter Mla MlaB component